MDPSLPSLQSTTPTDLLNSETPPPGIQENVLAGGEKQKTSPLAAFKKRFVPQRFQREKVDHTRIDEITSELQELADPVTEQFRRIRERRPEDIQKNAERAVQGIVDWYVAEKTNSHTSSRLGKILEKIPGRNPAAKDKKELQRKTESFRTYFDENVFNKVEHSTKSQLPDEAFLKSPGLLATEKGNDIRDNSAHTVDDDVLMGNTDYVFANFYDLPSRTFSQYGPNYVIESQDAFAVPVDIADLKIPSSMLKEDLSDFRLKQMKAYADNIFTFADFKNVFSLYSAAMFETPQDAITFFTRYGSSIDIAKAAFWESTSYWGQGNMTEDQLAVENNKLIQMKKLFINKGIYPPFSPEVQFKDKVTAKKRRVGFR